MSLLTDLAMTSRYARRLPAFLRSAMGPEQARRTLELQLATRTESFLRTVERGIFGRFKSPYRALFDWAGIGFPDLRRLVVAHGIEGALSRLYEAGVWVSLEEFKGYRPIERHGRVLPVRASDFDNPLISADFQGRTGGSRSAGRRLLIDLDLLRYDAAAHWVFLSSFGLLERPMGVWRSVPPDNSGIKKLLLQARIGKTVQRWFSQTPQRFGNGGARYVAFTEFTRAVAWLLGTPQAPPEHTPIEDARKVAEWLSAERRNGTPAQLDTIAGCAVRVCLAALENNLDISSTLFRAGSEPLTSAKARIIEKAGCRVVCHYAMSELGPVAMACADGVAVDDVHLRLDKVALVQRPRQVGNGGPFVDAFYLTTVLSCCPKLMINVETDDYGVAERRTCACAFGRLGFDWHLHTIRSYEKLTSEGIQFLGTELISLLEETLPARFGGAPSDYQFIEEEDQDGLPRVSVVVSPRVSLHDESLVIQTVLESLSCASRGHRLMTGAWQAGRTLRVLRREPYSTQAGKILPLHIIPKEAARNG